MHKFWSLLFLLVPVGCIALCVIAPWMGWWLPEQLSTYADDIDHLFNLILVITGIAFIATQLVLAYCLFRYGGQDRKATYQHGHHTLELVWTVVPSLILIFLAFYQLRAWAEIKFESKFPAEARENPLARVTGRQFEWRIRYPGPDGEFDTIDDLEIVNELHVPLGEPVVIHLQSMDVLHSFYIPLFRIKQDAVPGMNIPVWFEATKEGTYDLACAELCGWGHYMMRGLVTVHKDRAEFNSWLDELRTEQEYAGEVAQAGPEAPPTPQQVAPSKDTPNERDRTR